MGEQFTVGDTEYILYADLIERLCVAYPEVPRWRLEQIANAENDAITGGLLQVVPVAVEDGVIEMLTATALSNDDEVA